MKKHILFLAAAMVLTTLGATAQNQVDKQGRRQGHWVRTDKDGSKIYEGDFKDGLETGVFLYYYPSGAIRIRNTYSEPGRVCRHEAYDEQGHLLATGTYNQRNRDGQWRFFADDGHLVKQASYRMGVKDGQHVVFEQNGDTAEVAHWSNNHRHGRWWRRIGAKGYITGTYVEGALDGTLVEYNDSNQLVRRSLYTDGLKNGESVYFENNIVTIREQWNKGLLNDRTILVNSVQPNHDVIAEYISIHDIACIAARGKNHGRLLLRDGRELQSIEDFYTLSERAGNELFAMANQKSMISVARSCVQGIGSDSEGRSILLLEPKPSFTIFPDEDATKMIRSIQYENDSPLEKMLNE